MTTSYGREKTHKAISASRQVRSPRELTLTTAIALFRMKVAAMATYGIALVWKSDLTILDRRSPLLSADPSAIEEHGKKLSEVGPAFFESVDSRTSTRHHVTRFGAYCTGQTPPAYAGSAATSARDII